MKRTFCSGRVAALNSRLWAAVRGCLLLFVALAAQVASAVPLVATNGTSLTSFDSGALSSPTTIAITGMQPGETLVGIDFRPATGVLYGVGTTNRLYALSVNTGVATQIGAAGQFTLSGTGFGTDFNPVADRIRQVSNTEQNLRLNPDAASVVVDTNLNPAGNIVAVAYNNNLASSTQTTLFGIDSVAGTLVRIGDVNGAPSSPNGGQITSIGSLGLGTNLHGNIGFDITENGSAFATITTGGVSRLYSINLATGAATLIGTIGTGATPYLSVSGVVAPPPGVSLVATNGSNLTRFNSAALSTTTSVSIGGMQPGETLVGIDYRPTDGRLYGIGSTSRLYTLDPVTGAATQVGSAGAFTLNGTAFGMDFDAFLDRIRQVSNTEQNQRINPFSGTPVTPNTALNPPGNIVAVAYDRNFGRKLSESTPTTLFGIDSASGQLVRIGGVDGSPTPNFGAVTNLGSLGLGASLNENIGFDVAQNGVAFASFVIGGQSRLYSINLATGTASFLGVIGTGTTQFVGLTAVTVPARPSICYAVDAGNTLLTFSSATPGTIISSTPISGLIGGDIINGIDFRVATGELYALGSGNRLYKINPANGAATQVGSDNSFSFNLNPISFGFDFNPIVDRIRVTTDTDDENFRLNPNDGTLTATDTFLSYAAGDINSGQDPTIGGVAYTNSLINAANTTLFAIDTRANILARQGGVDGSNPSPNTGQLFTVGSLGINPTDDASRANTAFTVQSLPSSGSNVGYAAITTDGANSHLYHINLVTGQASALGRIGSSTLVRGLAVTPTASFEFSAPSYTVNESGTSASIEVIRKGDRETSAAVKISVTDGTATAPDDYTKSAFEITLLFSAGETSTSLTIPITNDSADEPDETVNLALSEPAGDAELGLLTTAVLTIIDDDKATPTFSVATSPPTTTAGQLFATATVANSAAAGGTITFDFFGPDNTSCSGSPIFTSTVPVSGDGTYTSGTFTPSRTGSYRVVATYSGDAANNAVGSACGDLDAAVNVTPATVLANIATRLRVESGDNVLIGGIIVTGTLPKRMLVRAIGPSSGVAGSLSNPYLELFAGPDLVADNDNWRDAPNQQEIIDSTIAPSDDREAAILVTLNPGQYTAVVSGVNGETGVGVVEAYDLDRSVDSKFANIATRGLVQTGNDVMIGGLIILGDTAQKVIVRAIGPSLGIAGQLEDPLLELFDGSGNPVSSNDNWRDTQQAEIEATTIPPPNDFESAIVASLPPAAYTAIVRGVNDTSGVALVEVYALD